MKERGRDAGGEGVLEAMVSSEGTAFQSIIPSDGLHVLGAPGFKVLSLTPVHDGRIRNQPGVRASAGPLHPTSVDGAVRCL